MALTHTWGYGSDAASAVSVAASAVTPVSTFALVTDEPDNCELINNSSQLDVGEMVSYSATKVNNVASKLDNQYPAPVNSGVQYVVRLDEQLLLTSASEASFKEILPVTAYVTIRHPKSGEISSAEVDTIFKRLVGACLKSDGSTRFSDLMKSALRPTTDGPAAAS
jgi:hypothetical protein